MVVDRTGLTGNWEFELTFAAEQRGQPPPGANIPAPDPDAPSLFTALQEQLGLRLESTKARSTFSSSTVSSTPLRIDSRF
jgi:uncharacterized protein (TIGR03435 family)